MQKTLELMERELPAPTLACPLLSIIIPARDEALFLPTCIDAIQSAARYASARTELIVVLNRCTDNTEEIALSRGCRIARDDSKNLARIRNTGAAVAEGEILVTIDADSRMSENMLQCVLEELAEPDVVGGGVLLLPERWSLGILLTALCLVPIALGSGISGGLFFCRRRDFEAIGGFNTQLCSVEDIDFARRLKAHGNAQRQRFVNLYRAHIVSSCRKFDRLGDWYFLTRPRLFMSLLKGRNRAAADNFWYDFKR